MYIRRIKVAFVNVTYDQSLATHQKLRMMDERQPVGIFLLG